MLGLVDIFKNVNIVQNYYKIMSNATIIVQNKGEVFLTAFWYRGNRIVVRADKHGFIYQYQAFTDYPDCKMLVNYHIPFVDEIVFCSKIADLFCNILPTLKGGSWYEKSYVDPTYHYSDNYDIKSCKCKRYLRLDKGHVTRCSLRVLCQGRDLQPERSTSLC